MKITNKTNLPEAFVKACEREENVEGVRVTSLLNGVRAMILTQRHWDEIEEDAANMVWLILGTAVHKILEMTEEGEDEFREERLSMKISDTILTGKSDLFKNGVITDYKTTTTYKVTGNDYDDYKKQLLLYAMLWKNAGFEVKGGEILTIMRDHMMAKAGIDNYPLFPAQMIRWNFTEKDIKEIEKWATKKIKLIENLKDVPDEELPLCTPEERYNSGDRWAIMKTGVKKAKKICDTKEEAQELMSQYKGDHIEIRKGEDRKCLKYCRARAFCEHAKKLKGEQDEVQGSEG